MRPLALLVVLAASARGQALEKAAVQVGTLALSGKPSAEETKDRSGVHRLNSLGWFALDSEGKALGPPYTELPALTRVVVLPGKTPKGLVAAVYSKGGKLGEAYLKVKAVEPDTASSFDPGSSEIPLFFDEALQTMALADALDRGYEKDYSLFRLALAKKLACLALSPGALAGSWAAFKKDAAEGLAIDPADRVAAQEKLKDVVFSVHNPKSGTKALKDETLVVGVDQSWFLSVPALAAYYKGTFMSAVGDTRLGGDSGEGLTGDGLEAYKKALLELKAYVAGLGDASLSKTPEARWLAALSEEKLKPIKRLIFIHDETWGALGTGAQWASYIPVDQSFAGLKSHHILSVLIHEINVNSSSPSLLAGDTHGYPPDGEALWKKVAAEGLGALKDADAQKTFFQLQPFLGTIYLGYYADKLVKYVPACR